MKWSKVKKFNNNIRMIVDSNSSYIVLIIFIVFIYFSYNNYKKFRSTKILLL